MEINLVCYTVGWRKQNCRNKLHKDDQTLQSDLCFTVLLLMKPITFNESWNWNTTTFELPWTANFFPRCYTLTVRFTKLLTSGSRGSFEITEVRYELGNFIMYLSIKLWTWRWSCEFHTELWWEVNKFIARKVCTVWSSCLGISLDVVVTSFRNY